MDRLACINVIDLPLQLLLSRNPGWIDSPVVVVDADQPNGVVEWVNKHARRAQIAPGMRYGQALSLKHDLKAGCVMPEEVDHSVEQIARRLLDYTPVVEAADEQPGIFWLDAAGLDALFDSFERWADALAEELLERAGFYTTIVVGFSRFGTWAVARAKRGGVYVVADRDLERRLIRRVPLLSLHVDPRFRDELEKLGIATLGEFLELPAAGVRRRFGDRAYALFRRARGDLKIPLRPFAPDDAPGERLEFDRAEVDSTRLIFWIKRYLHPLLVELGRRQDKLVRLEICLVYARRAAQPDEGPGSETFEVRPASPTVDEAQILDLLRLRLESLELCAGVIEVELCAHTTRAQQEQLRMFMTTQKRDLDAANRALARLRAEFGPEAVCRARLVDAHLPEASFEWARLERLEPAEPDEVELRPLVRRIRRRPQPLSAPRADPDDLAGPFVISGGWWARLVERHYHFAEDDDGRIDWVFWDEKRQRWFRHGGFE